MKTKNKKHDIVINGKKFKINSSFNKKEVNTKVKIDEIVFDTLQEFTYFVNMLTDICDELIKQERDQGEK